MQETINFRHKETFATIVKKWFAHYQRALKMTTKEAAKGDLARKLEVSFETLNSWGKPNSGAKSIKTINLYKLLWIFACDRVLHIAELEEALQSTTLSIPTELTTKFFYDMFTPEFLQFNSTIDTRYQPNTENIKVVIQVLLSTQSNHVERIKDFTFYLQQTIWSKYPRLYTTTFQIGSFTSKDIQQWIKEPPSLNNFERFLIEQQDYIKQGDAKALHPLQLQHLNQLYFRQLHASDQPFSSQSSSPNILKHAILRQKLLEDEIKIHLNPTDDNINGIPKRNIILYGIPGIGKSTLAVMLANDSEVKRWYRDSIFWEIIGKFESDPDKRLLGMMNRILKQLTPDSMIIQQFTSLNDAQQELKKQLTSLQVLFIIDDVWDAQFISKFSQVLGERCVLFVTTRIQGNVSPLKHTGIIQHGYELEPLTIQESQDLVHQQFPELLDWFPELTKEILVKLEGLPLAIHLMCSYLFRYHSHHQAKSLIHNKLKSLKINFYDPIASQHLVQTFGNDNNPTLRFMFDKTLQEITLIQKIAFYALCLIKTRPAIFDELMAAELIRSTSQELNLIDNINEYDVSELLLDLINVGLITVYEINSTVSFYSIHAVLCEYGLRLNFDKE